MAGIKRKSGTTVQTDGKIKAKKVRVDKPTKRSGDRDVVRHAKGSQKVKRNDDSDELMESDTSEPENGFYGFSAKGAATGDDATDDGETGFVGGALEAALEDDTKKDRKQERKDKNTKKEHRKDKEDSGGNSAAEEKPPALAGLNGEAGQSHPL